MVTKEFLETFQEVLDKQTTKRLFQLIHEKTTEITLINQELKRRYEEGLRDKNGTRN